MLLKPPVTFMLVKCIKNILIVTFHLACNPYKNPKKTSYNMPVERFHLFPIQILLFLNIPAIICLVSVLIDIDQAETNSSHMQIIQDTRKINIIELHRNVYDSSY